MLTENLEKLHKEINRSKGWDELVQTALSVYELEVAITWLYFHLADQANQFVTNGSFEIARVVRGESPTLFKRGAEAWVLFGGIRKKYPNLSGKFFAKLVKYGLGVYRGKRYLDKASESDTMTVEGMDYEIRQTRGGGKHS